jgi:hypothetical protein
MHHHFTSTINTPYPIQIGVQGQLIHGSFNVIYQLVSATQAELTNVNRNIVQRLQRFRLPLYLQHCLFDFEACSKKHARWRLQRRAESLGVCRLAIGTLAGETKCRKLAQLQRFQILKR